MQDGTKLPLDWVAEAKRVELMVACGAEVWLETNVTEGRIKVKPPRPGQDIVVPLGEITSEEEKIYARFWVGDEPVHVMRIKLARPLGPDDSHMLTLSFAQGIFS